MSLTNKEKKIVDSEREILWLKRQIEQYETESTPDKDDIHIPAVATSEHVEESVNIYRTHINSVRLQLDILSQFNLTKDELTKNIDYQHFTVESLYPKQSAFSDTDRIQWIQDKIKERDELVVEFMNILNDLNQKKLQLNNVQKSIIDQHILSNQLLLAGEDDDLKELRKALRDIKDETAIVRAVLNGVILESGINWSKDEKWLETMLRIGEELPIDE